MQDKRNPYPVPARLRALAGDTSRYRVTRDEACSVDCAHWLKLQVFCYSSRLSVTATV
jgi:hypothetical protein